MDSNKTYHMFVEGFAGEQDDGLSAYAVIITDGDGRMLHMQSGAFDDGPGSGAGKAYGARLRGYTLGCHAAKMLGIRKCMLHSDPDITTDAMYATLAGRQVDRDEDRDPDYFGTGVFTAFIRDTPHKEWWDHMSVEAAGMSGRALGTLHSSARQAGAGMEQ